MINRPQVSFFVKLETEDSEGNRTFLWGDDYIYK